MAQLAVAYSTEAYRESARRTKAYGKEDWVQIKAESEGIATELAALMKQGSPPSSPEATMRVLEEKLPREYWIEINRRLVPFGKHICTGHLPKCSTCPVLQYCRQVGVVRHR